MRFQDRTDAGRQLADALEKYKKKEAVVYAIPRGGVPIGVCVAHALDIPLDLAITRKIGHPDNPEYAIAAVSEGGELAQNTQEVAQISPEWFMNEVFRKQTEAQERRQKYLGGKKNTDIRGKVAIVVDDGLATGLTMKAALMNLRAKNPSRTVVAVPVAPKETDEEMKDLADDVVVLYSPEYFVAVGAFYDDFPQVTDEEVIELLKEFRQ